MYASNNNNRTPLSGQAISLIVTGLALGIAAALWADVYFHGIVAAAPRDALALVTFALVRWFIARTAHASTASTRNTDTF